MRWRREWHLVVGVGVASGGRGGSGIWWRGEWHLVVGVAWGGGWSRFHLQRAGRRDSGMFGGVEV